MDDLRTSSKQMLLSEDSRKRPRLCPAAALTSVTPAALCAHVCFRHVVCHCKPPSGQALVCFLLFNDMYSLENNPFYSAESYT
ncbi:Single-Minded-like 1 [Manis pentadactyla]|nr:Single-Minded-like 1 [Manis pentadactyla]